MAAAAASRGGAEGAYTSNTKFPSRQANSDRDGPSWRNQWRTPSRTHSRCPLAGSSDENCAPRKSSAKRDALSTEGGRGGVVPLVTLGCPAEVFISASHCSAVRL